MMALMRITTFGLFTCLCMEIISYKKSKETHYRSSTFSSPLWRSSRRSGRVGCMRPPSSSSLSVKASSTPGVLSSSPPRRRLLRHQVLEPNFLLSPYRYWNGIELLSMRVFTALSAAVYKKSLTLSSTGRNQYTASQVPALF